MAKPKEDQIKDIAYQVVKQIDKMPPIADNEIKKYVKKSIDSLVNQTTNEIEIILVDDGSTDGSSSLCDYYAERDGRIRVIHQQNYGLVLARKVGIQNAVGKYIGFVDADDWIEPDFYEILYNALEKSQADFAHVGFIQENPEGESICRITFK